MKASTIENIIKNLLNTEGSQTDEKIRLAAAWALGRSSIDLATMQPAILQPITETLNQANAGKYYFKPQEVTLDKGTFFPTVNKPQTGLSEYLKNLEGINSWAALEFYGSSIACDAAFPDVTLFDFVKTTTALTDILTKGDDAVIVCGNVSGIQTYIYDIISRSAAKNMKGRSFYVQLLTETILQKTLDALGLQSFHVLYASGGGFYILAPTNRVLNDDKTEQTDFAKLRQDINQVLRQEHGLGLSFDLLHSDPIAPEDKNFNEKWSELFRRGEKAKMRRHASALETDAFDAFFTAHEIGGDQERDVITNEEFRKDELVKYVDKEKTLPIRKITKDQIELGRILKTTNYWTITTKPLNRGDKEFQLYDWQIFHNFSENPLQNAHSLVSQRALNNPSVKTGFTYYGGNRFPTNTDEDGKQSPKFFEELAQGNDFDRLGILRMDVDNLGSLIQKGITKPCLARLSTLSHSLDYFFKGYLNTIWKDDKNREDYSFILYSGGDDLFIIGRWDVIMSFALDIQNAFKEWVCHNPDLTISGGVVLVPPKFPIVQAAELAKDAEKNAKKHVYQGKEKNAFCFLNMPLDWTYEMPLVLKLKKQLMDLLIAKTISKSLLDKINTYASMSQPKKVKYDKDVDKEEQDKNKSHRWKWVMTYDLTRYSQTLKDETAKAFVQQIYTAAHANTDLGLKDKIKSKYHFIELLQIAARWAEFDLRTEKIKNNE